MSAIDEKIAKANADINYHRGQINLLTQYKEAWQLSADKMVCNQTLAKNRNACLADKAQKASKAVGYGQEIGHHLQQIALLEKEIEAFVKQREAEADAIKILAQQGTTPGAVQAAATAQADAARIAAQSTAQADLIKSEKSAQNQQIAIVAVILILVVIVIIAIRNRVAKS